MAVARQFCWMCAANAAGKAPDYCGSWSIDAAHNELEDPDSNLKIKTMNVTPGGIVKFKQAFNREWRSR